MYFTQEELENETWLPILNWETFYQVSDLGRVKRLDYNGFTKSGNKHFYRGGILKQEIGGKCYITFRQSEKSERRVVYELVFNTFNPNNTSNNFRLLDGDTENNRLNNIAIVPDGFKFCNACEKDVTYEDFYLSEGVAGTYCKKCSKTKVKENAIKNSENIKTYKKQYDIDNKEVLYQNKKIYRENNKEYFREYMRNYQVERRKNDNLFRIKHNVRNRLWEAFKNKNWKKDGSEKLLGANYQIVKEYLESLFTDNMSWDNYGRCVEGDCDNYWHIDHKIPLNTATTKEEMEELCHYSNLQPLWAIDNLRKPKNLE